jgi:hypothetical protein
MSSRIDVLHSSLQQLRHFETLKQLILVAKNVIHVLNVLNMCEETATLFFFKLI